MKSTVEVAAVLPDCAYCAEAINLCAYPCQGRRLVNGRRMAAGRSHCTRCWATGPCDCVVVMAARPGEDREPRCAFCCEPKGHCGLTGGQAVCTGQHEFLALYMDIMRAPRIQIGGGR